MAFGYVAVYVGNHGLVIFPTHGSGRISTWTAGDWAENPCGGTVLVAEGLRWRRQLLLLLWHWLLLLLLLLLWRWLLLWQWLLLLLLLLLFLRLVLLLVLLLELLLERLL